MHTNSVKTGPLVQVRDLVKSYGPTLALSGVTLDVNAGEVLGIVGHNGAGKSTLMRALSGIETPSSGTIEIDGQMVPEKSGYRGVRMAYQEGSLALELTVTENIFMSGARWLPKWKWNRPAAMHASQRLAEIFPDNTISPSDFVDDLALADRQRVEI